MSFNFFLLCGFGYEKPQHERIIFFFEISSKEIFYPPNNVDMKHEDQVPNGMYGSSCEIYFFEYWWTFWIFWIKFLCHAILPSRTFPHSHSNHADVITIFELFICSHFEYMLWCSSSLFIHESLQKNVAQKWMQKVHKKSIVI